MLSAFFRAPAFAEPAIALYGPEQGLGNVGVGCLLQGRFGYLLICTEHGVYQYDGRRFGNLGQAQGLREGGEVYALIATTGGRIALVYNSEIYVSEEAASRTRPWTSIHFAPVLHPGVSFNNDRVSRVAAWHDGLVAVTEDGLRRIVVPAAGPAFMTEIDDPAPETVGARIVFDVGGHLWVGLGDNRLCSAEPRHVRCYGEKDGLPPGPWFAMVRTAEGTILARSAKAVATFDPTRNRFTATELPDQDVNRYTNYLPLLGLFTLPDGRIATQSDHGLLLWEAGGWRLMPLGRAVPNLVVAALLTDADGNVWIAAIGTGVLRWVGYDRWATLDGGAGAPGTLPWQTARAPDGQVWVATDAAVEQIRSLGDGVLGVGLSVPGSSFAIATGPDGRIWSSQDTHGLRVVDPSTGSTLATVATPTVDVILPVGPDSVWVGTENGLWRVPMVNGAIGTPVPVAAQHRVVMAMTPDGAGGLFYISDGIPRHRHRDGRDTSLDGFQPDAAIEPLAMTLDHRNNLWVGGSGGLVRLRLDGDRVLAATAINAAETRTNSIVALYTDHRGWVWVGTGRGVSVFDGQRWASLDTGLGLPSDDISQNGLREDPDGSMWIATPRGVSHLLDPGWLFADPHIQVTISGATIGDRPVSDSIPYSLQPVELRFGTTSYGRERSIVFRYRLSGVDADWATTASGAVHYPFLPPGRHALEVVAYDELSRRSSAPVRLDMAMAYPWWRQWWFELAVVFAAAALFQGLVQLRLRLALARQSELRRLVDEATAEIRATQERLRHQAQHDALTGLLTRSEIERRLAARLDGAHGDRELAIALMDIDHFKSINDGFGHLGGDDVLRSVGMLVAGAMYGRDEAGRYGGEEILLVLDDHDGRGGERILILHRLIRGTSFTAAGRTLRVTCSVGVAWARRGDDWETLIGRADEALYEAKRTGRDRVVEARQPDGDGGNPVDRRRAAP